MSVDSPPAAGPRPARSSDDRRFPRPIHRRILESLDIGDDPALMPATEGAATRTGTAPVEWLEEVRRALQGHPLRLSPCELSPNEVVQAVGPHTPLITWSNNSGWVLLLANKGRRSLLVDPSGGEHWISVGELTRRLHVGSPDDPQEWVLIEQTEPCSPASSPKNGARLAPLTRLLRLLEPDRADLWAIVLYAVFIGGLSLATPIAVQQLVNTVAFGALIQPVLITALLLFGGLAFSGLLSVLQAFVAELIQRRLFVRVSVDLAGRIPRVQSQAFEEKHGPELVNRIFDVFTVQKAGAALLLEGTSIVLQTVVGLVVLSLYHPWMLAFSFLLVVGIATLILSVRKPAVSTAIQESYAKYEVASWMEELARNPATFRHPDALDYAIERADSLVARYIQARRTHYRYVLGQTTGAQALQVFAGTTLLALGGALVVTGQMTLGQLVAAELIITAIVAAVAKLGKQLESFYDLLAATDKLGVLFDLPLEATPDAGEAGTGTGPARVELHGVSALRGTRALFQGLDQRIEAGERVLLAGPSGSGKSTLLELLIGLRPPDAGFVSLDGQDLRELRLADLREQVMTVSVPEIFPGTLLENVRIARPELTSGDVREVLDDLGVLSTFRSLPDGLSTTLSTSGDPLSGSELRALMLARVILARPRLLLLDEGALQLDLATRARALDLLFADDAPWTLVVVSQLEEVRERCDRVLALAPAGSEPQEEDSTR